MQLVAVLELRHRDALALRRITRRRCDAIAALGDVERSWLELPEIESGDGADAAHGKPPLEWELVAVQPSPQYEPAIDPGRRRESVVAPQIEQHAAVCQACRSNRTRQWSCRPRIRNPSGSALVLGE